MNKYIFNFSASHSGGGLKRIIEYINAMNNSGGAVFILHQKCREKAEEYKNNRYHFVSATLFSRIVNDDGYLDDVVSKHGRPEFYYSYGIPIHRRVGKVNWYHLSSVLPLAVKNIPMSIFDHVRTRYLGRQIRKSYRNADVISAESMYSLGLIDASQSSKLFLSVNGSDDELNTLEKNRESNQEAVHEMPWAIVVGTVKYKSLDDSFRVYNMLREAQGSGLKLKIIGGKDSVPSFLRKEKNVELLGVLPRSEVVSLLKRARYYISTTRLENSYNAASEGACLSRDSFISDIPPHRELLINTPFKMVVVPGVISPIIHVQRKDISGNQLKPWALVIEEMLSNVRSLLKLNG
jgi:hypothetical protein